jgi:hypothetical protein
MVSFNNATQLADFSVQGDITKNCEVDDYESWTINEKCLNGEIASYLSKKDKAKCVHPKYYNEIFRNTKKRCVCTEEDFECDFNFVRQDHACVNVEPNYYVLPTICIGYYKLYNGVKRIAGNKCRLTEAHREFNITSYVCPSYFSVSTYSTSSIIIMMIILFAILGYLVRKCLAKPTEPATEKVYAPANKVDEEDTNLDIQISSIKETTI